MGTATPDSRPELLLVDDAPENLVTLAAVLDGDYRIRVASSGARALRILHGEVRPDLVLLDVMMPGMDGLSVCRQMQESPQLRDIPVIFVTALSDPVDEAKGLQAGAVDYITKPVNPAVVRQRVRLHLELRHARRALEQLGLHFKSYLSPEVASSIVRGEVPTGISASRRDLTVLFADIVGFTHLTDRIAPAELSGLLNDYFDVVQTIVGKYSATLDKFIGDACMVVVGDPTSRGPAADAIAAVAMALELQSKVASAIPRWSGVADEALRIRVGIASGPCMVGNFGSRQQITYTAVGSTVNLAARLEAAAQPGQVLIAQETFARIGDIFTCVEQAPITVKGIDRPLMTFVVQGARRPLTLPPGRPISERFTALEPVAGKG